MAGAHDIDGELALDPAERAVLLDLFTEIAVLEHIMRNRLKPDYAGVFTPAEFGLLNYFCRNNRVEDRLSHVALSFEVDEAEARLPLVALVVRGWLTADSDADPCIRLTSGGRQVHDAMVIQMAPEIQEIVGEIDPEQLRITAATLKEIRRTAANLPPR